MKCCTLLLIFLAGAACDILEYTLDWSNFRDKVEIGQGSFGLVFKATRKADNKEFAIKEQKPTKPEHFDLAKKEIALLKEITNHQLQYVTPLRWYDIKPTKDIYMGFDLYSGDLKKFLENAPATTRKAQSDMIAFRLLVGLYELRRTEIGNFDIKPENILINDKNRPFIADFGLAQTIREGETKYGSRGTALYMAPEMLLHNKYTIRVDVWSMGLVLYELFSGKQAINTDPNSKIEEQVENLKLDSNGNWPHYPDNPSIDYKKLICNEMVIKYNDRISANEIFSSYLTPWLGTHENNLPQFRSSLKRRCKNEQADREKLFEILEKEDKKAKKATKQYGFSEVPTDPLRKPICKKKNKKGKFVDC